MTLLRALILVLLAPTLACGDALITEEIDLDDVISDDDLEAVRDAPDDAERCNAACIVLLEAELVHGYESADVLACEAVGVDPDLDTWDSAQAEVSVMCTVEYTWAHGHY
jgi:hypothetical protein